MTAAAPRHPNTNPAACPTCARLTAAGRAQDNPGAGRALARLIDHHIDVHQAAGTPHDDCHTCQRKQRTEHYSPIHAYWAHVHYVMHQLGITADSDYPRLRHDEPLYPLRYEDTPPPTPGQ